MPFMHAHEVGSLSKALDVDNNHHVAGKDMCVGFLCFDVDGKWRVIYRSTPVSHVCALDVQFRSLPHPMTLQR